MNGSGPTSRPACDNLRELMPFVFEREGVTGTDSRPGCESLLVLNLELGIGEDERVVSWYILMPTLSIEYHLCATASILIGSSEPHFRIFSPGIIEKRKREKGERLQDRFQDINRMKESLIGRKGETVATINTREGYGNKHQRERTKEQLPLKPYPTFSPLMPCPCFPRGNPQGCIS